MRRTPLHDRVLASVLFTDIVGSTERAAQIGDRRWQELVARHHRIVRTQLKRFRGREIDTAGDGFLATFDSPARGDCHGRHRDVVRSLPEVVAVELAERIPEAVELPANSLDVGPRRGAPVLRFEQRATIVATGPVGGEWA